MKVEKIIIFALGSLFGAGATYFVMQGLSKDEFEEDVVEVKERVIITPGEPSSTKPKKESTRSEMKKIIRQYDGSGKAEELEADGDYPSEDDEDPAAWRQYADDIYIISDEQFNEGMPGQESISIFYYAEDGVLADTDETAFEDPTQIIGFEALPLLTEGDFLPDVVYVRNEKFGIDYEVIRLEKSYVETMAMFPPGDDQDDEN